MAEGKKKKSFKKNEMILLIVLGIIVYFGVVVKMLLLPEYQKLSDSKLKLEDTTVEYNHIKAQIENIDALKESEEKAKKTLLTESSKIPPVIDRERILLSMCDYSVRSNVSIESYTFSGQNIYPFEGFAVGAGADNQAMEADQVEKDAEVMIVSAVDMRFKSYEDGLYKFLKAFESSEPSLYLKSCVIESSEENGELTGVVTMEYLAYKGKLSEYNVNLGLKVPAGRSTVFPSPVDIMKENQEEEMKRIKKELEELNSGTQSN